MPRTRAKSPPRLTRDAERLIALANGLNASGSVTEDRYWEGEMSALAARLLENGNDAPIEGALDLSTIVISVIGAVLVVVVVSLITGTRRVGRGPV